MVMIVVVVLDLGDIGAVMLERRWITSGCSWSVKEVDLEIIYGQEENWQTWLTKSNKMAQLDYEKFEIRPRNMTLLIGTEIFMRLT